MTSAPAAPIECDVLVAGSGAGGLAAAVAAAFHGLSVVVAEKEPVFGGTTAWSGGWLWIPRNPLARRAGIEEDPEEPLAYLKCELGNRVADPRIPAYLANGPDMVAFFEQNTAVQWIDGNRIPDFHDTPGSRQGGRSVCARPFDGRALGQDIARLKPPLDLVSLAGMGIAAGADMNHFFNATRSARSALHVAGRLARHARDRALHGRAMQLVNGNALVARLMKSALDLGVTLMENAPITALRHDGDRVCGATLGSGVEIVARRGVVLATGGFPHDRGRIARLFDHAPDGTGHFSAAPRSNTGDGIRLGETAGARITGDEAAAGAWCPVSLVPRSDGGFAHFPHLVDRAKPGFIAVTPDGRRFVNEAGSYHDFMTALFAATPGAAKPECWLICDHRAQRRFGIGWAKPFPFPLRPYQACGYLKSGRTLEALAAPCGLPAGALAETVARFNAHAKAGDDPDFGRGRSPYNRVQGDSAHGPNPSLGALEEGPFHAVRLVPGSLGTFAGMATDAEARVLDVTGAPIPGLYAAGNDMASIFGGHYPSGGITLGPAMTFGYIAARHMAGLAGAGAQTTDNRERSDEILRTGNP
ncbi:MAG: FAD-binding dehydrogenase [Phyllobacteriaceae bacterium]|nr:FAD-binding dehydrogenase [Phyllobacteriaceae bacterium]MBA91474.1 FAD-binding dehydrogenase [Phyllobacteriaceae bacterium]